MVEPSERPFHLHPLRTSSLRPPLTSSSTYAGVRPVLINIMVGVNLLNCLGDGNAWLGGLIVPLEREELSVQSKNVMADNILHCTHRVMYLIFISLLYVFSLIIAGEFDLDHIKERFLFYERTIERVEASCQRLGSSL